MVIPFGDGLFRVIVWTAAVNAISPGGTKTDMASENYADGDIDTNSMMSLQRLAEPAEIAAAVAFLVSPDASYITGSALRVDGGLI